MEEPDHLYAFVAKMQCNIIEKGHPNSAGLFASKLLTQ